MACSICYSDQCCGECNGDPDHWAVETNDEPREDWETNNSFGYDSVDWDE